MGLVPHGLYRVGWCEEGLSLVVWKERSSTDLSASRKEDVDGGGSYKCGHT